MLERHFIEQAALKMGFSGVGFAPAEALEPEGSRLRGWLEQGHAGSMSWLEARTELRCDPAAGFGARSVVVVTLPYGSERPEPEAGEGRVARYARGRDYHNLMGKRLKKLARAVRDRYPGAEARSYVDTGPVLEKAWGARAGLGWQGKNTLLIAPESGSWFFLGVLLTTLDLGDSEAVPDQCGECSLCVEICPSGALVAPYVLDSRLCLSYLTIEERGAIPEPLREFLGDHVFGCDLCQEVCPYNQGRTTDAEADFMRGTPHESLESLIALDQEAFDQLTRGRALRRAGRAGLARNACITAGLSGDPSLIPALEQARDHDPSPLVRSHAAWALARLG